MASVNSSDKHSRGWAAPALASQYGQQPFHVATWGEVCGRARGTSSSVRERLTGVFLPNLLIFAILPEET